MKYLKRFLCALLVCALMTPAVVFAEPEEGEIITVESTENIYSYDDASVSLFADNSNMTQCVDYIVSEMGKTVPAKTIDISSYKIGATNDNAKALLNNVRYAVLYQHPEIFYLLNASANDSAQFSMSIYGGIITSIVLDYVDPQTNRNVRYYTMSDDEIVKARETIDAECDNIISLTNDDMTELEKLLVVHDYIVANYEYDTTYTSRHLDTMVSQKTGVCEGYAYLLKYVLNKLNIDCVTVPSNAHQHMWNKVKLDGNWYNVDATHDDPLPNMSRNISHDHFLLTDTETQQLDDNEHTSWESLDYIEPATDDTYSSSVLHGISGQIVYKDGNFYCIDDDNNICTIDFANNTLTPVYTNSSKFMWRPYGNASSRYIKTYTSLAFYDGDIYFNSADKIYMLDTNTYEAKEVYEYTAEKDVSNTYLFGLKAADDDLYAEYTTDLSSGDMSLIPTGICDSKAEEPTAEPTMKPTEEPTVTAEPIETAAPTENPNPTPVPTAVPIVCETEITPQDDGVISISVSVLEDEDYTPEEDDMVYVAEYKDGIIVNIFPESLSKLLDDSGLSYTLKKDNSTTLKVFVWNDSCSPLAALSSLNLSEE